MLGRKFCCGLLMIVMMCTMVFMNIAIAEDTVVGYWGKRDSE